MLVLAYHAVSDGFPGNPFVMPPDEFESQLRFLSNRYEFQDAGKLDAGSLPRNGAVLTFDDGYEDNYRIAYPIARRLGIPMAIFVATGTIGKRMQLGGQPLPCLTEAQIREMAGSGLVRFGSHTHGHLLLDEIPDPRVFDRDILESRAILEELTGSPPDLFVYPKNRYNPLHRPTLESLFRIAFRGGGIARSGCDPLQIPRVELLSGDGWWRRRLKISGAYYRIRGIRNAFSRGLPRGAGSTDG